MATWPMYSRPTGSTAVRIWSDLAALCGLVQPPIAAVSTGQKDAYAGHEEVVPGASTPVPQAAL